MSEAMTYPVFHRKEQWDLECWPWLCIHIKRPDSSTRVFCIWGGGIQVGSWIWTRKKRPRWDAEMKPTDDGERR